MRIGLVKPPIAGHRLRGSGIYYEKLCQHLAGYRDIDLFTGSWSDVRGKADVYHFAYFDLFFLTLPFKLPARSIITVHDVIPLKFPKHFPVGFTGKLKLTLEKIILNQAEVVVTDSESSKSDIANLLKINRQKIEVVYLAAGDNFSKKKTGEEIAKVLNQYKLPDKFFLYVGDGNWNKNLPNIIQATLRTKVNLVLVGPPLKEKPVSHPWTASLNQSYELIQGRSNIFSLRNVTETDLSCLYAGAQALIFPSYYEGFGLPVVEAFASGCPVITSHQGSLAEIAGEVALFVDPDNVDKIIEAIKKVNKSFNLRNKLRQLGLKQAARFSWKKTAEQTAAVYKQVYDL